MLDVAAERFSGFFVFSAQNLWTPPDPPCNPLDPPPDTRGPLNPLALAFSSFFRVFGVFSQILDLPALTY